MLQAARATPDWKGKLSSECLLSDYFNLLLDVNLNELTPGSRWTENNHQGGWGAVGGKGGAQARADMAGASEVSPGLANFGNGRVIDWGRGAARLSIPFPSLNYHNKFSNFVLFIYQARTTKKAQEVCSGGTRTKPQTESSHVRRDERRHRSSSTWLFFLSI